MKWFSTLKPPQPTLVGEALPPGVPTMASRYGVFGGKALITGVPGDERLDARFVSSRREGQRVGEA